MPSRVAAACALARSREAMAVMAQYSPRCIAGTTFSVPMLAVLRIPQRTFRIVLPPDVLSDQKSLHEHLQAPADYSILRSRACSQRSSIRVLAIGGQKVPVVKNELL